ncbi:MAG TPA: tRNA uridine-5-carboxymethylaminomethyl(34) synthesis GTPase MnmE [Pyrinomonadaceae bacterium]|jgi:tRNA modification GTPase
MDTIVAIATSPGRSAIGLIRLSGPSALNILRGLIRDPVFNPQPRRVYLKEIFRESGELIDEALVCFFASPQSFTGEDMIEISCHGSPLILRRVLDLTQKFGARLAGPGEFTLRACENGKMNLTQAEAVRDLIDAQTDAAASQALRQLSGELSATLQPAKNKLIHIIVRMESALEFVEDDLPQIETKHIAELLADVTTMLSNLSATFAAGRVLRNGIKVTLVGCPNVGKSSVFNRLVGVERAIVTEIPGTTRDTITESIMLGGIAVSLTDTAGIRKAEGRIEEFGVERTHRAAADSDLLLVVVDGSRELTSEDRAILAEARGPKHVIAVNKSDLPSSLNGERWAPEFSPMVHVSAVTGEGLDELTAAIVEPFGTVDSDAAGLLITDSRHYDLLLRAQGSLEKSGEILAQGASEELVLVGLHNALRFLGEITGETTAEDILAEIFNTFCIGK